FKSIEQANPGVNSSRLRIGQQLRIPQRPADTRANAPASSRADATAALGAREYRVQPNDSLNRIAGRLYGDATRWEEIYDLNRQTIGSDPARLQVGTVLKLPEEP